MYKLVFKGEIFEGRDVERVKRNLASLHKMPLSKVEKMFSGRPITIKEDSDKNNVLSIKAAYERAGAVCEVFPKERAALSNPAPAPSAATAPPPPPPPAVQSPSAGKPALALRKPSPFPSTWTISDCISEEEKRKRLGSIIANGILWLVILLLVFSSMGGMLLLVAFSWLMSHILAEYNVRKLQALGTTASKRQFPEIDEALTDVCRRLGVEKKPKVIIVAASEVNALSIRFARKKIIVLFSKTLEGVLDNPEELRFLLGHEVAHIALDFGVKGYFEIYKPPPFKAARELTCDNCGSLVAGDPEAAKRILKKTGVGNSLYDRLDEEYLASEAKYITSGLTGYFLKQKLAYPPLGKRIENVSLFFAGASRNAL